MVGRGAAGAGDARMLVMRLGLAKKRSASWPTSAENLGSSGSGWSQLRRLPPGSHSWNAVQ